MRSLFLLFTCFTSLALGVWVSVAFADQWRGPRPETFVSKGDTYRFKTSPPPADSRHRQSTGILFKRGKGGQDEVVWQQKLVNIPHRAFVAADGKFVATVDTYAKLGHDHSLVIYGEKGKVICDLNLEALLTKEEIASKVKQTVSSRWWSEDAQFSFEGKHFVIRLQWGKVIKVELATGKVL